MVSGVRIRLLKEAAMVWPLIIIPRLEEALVLFSVLGVIGSASYPRTSEDGSKGIEQLLVSFSSSLSL